MQKALMIALSMIVIVSLCIVLVACDKEKQNTSNGTTFDEEKPTDNTNGTATGVAHRYYLYTYFTRLELSQHLTKEPT